MFHCVQQHTVVTRDFELKLDSPQTHLLLHYHIVQGNFVLEAFWMFLDFMESLLNPF